MAFKVIPCEQGGYFQERIVNFTVFMNSGSPFVLDKCKGICFECVFQLPTLTLRILVSAVVFEKCRIRLLVFFF